MVLTHKLSACLPREVEQNDELYILESVFSKSISKNNCMSTERFKIFDVDRIVIKKLSNIT